MATATLTKTDYTAGIVEILRRLPVDKQAQVYGYANAIEHTLEPELDEFDAFLASSESVAYLQTLEPELKAQVAAGEFEDMGAGFARLGLVP